jgi:hypothetical protein
LPVRKQKSTKKTFIVKVTQNANMSAATATLATPTTSSFLEMEKQLINSARAMINDKNLDTGKKLDVGETQQVLDEVDSDESGSEKSESDEGTSSGTSSDSEDEETTQEQIVEKKPEAAAKASSPKETSSPKAASPNPTPPTPKSSPVSEKAASPKEGGEDKKKKEVKPKTAEQKQLTNVRAKLNRNLKSVFEGMKDYAHLHPMSATVVLGNHFRGDFEEDGFEDDDAIYEHLKETAEAKVDKCRMTDLARHWHEYMSASDEINTLLAGKKQTKSDSTRIANMATLSKAYLKLPGIVQYVEPVKGAAAKGKGKKVVKSGGGKRKKVCEQQERIVIDSSDDEDVEKPVVVKKAKVVEAKVAKSPTVSPPVVKSGNSKVKDYMLYKRIKKIIDTDDMEQMDTIGEDDLAKYLELEKVFAK